MIPGSGGRHSAEGLDAPTDPFTAQGQPVDLDEHPPEAPTEGDDEGSALSSLVVSHLRTVVPVVWGAVVAWLVDRLPWFPVSLAGDPAAVGIVTAAATVVWYALWRAVEPRLPRAVTALVLGHPAEPDYPD